MKKINEKKINLADKAKAFELLKQLYGTEATKNANGATISKNPQQSTIGEKRGYMANGMGLNGTSNSRHHHPHSKRR
jgi:hypothetical protein